MGASRDPHVVVIGAGGQLGRELCQQLGERARGVDVDTFDLTDPAIVASRLERWRPRAVVNCAAYTQVDRAESEPQAARAVNAEGVGHLVEVCRRLDCPLAQVSTDYVFAGSAPRGRPWREDDPPSPLGVYAATKYEGEQFAAAAPKHWIIRTCGLYARPSDRAARNFVRTMLRLAAEGRDLGVVADQHCTPTYVPHLARAIVFLLGGADRPAAPWGLYHVTNTGETTWYEFAVALLRLAGFDAPVRRLTTAEYGAPAPRPAYSVLDTSKYHGLGGPAMPHWKAALEEFFAEAPPEVGRCAGT